MALVVQGGGMRGVYSMGALAAIQELGASSAFTHLIGSSSGAINLAYFAARQADEAIEVYLDHLTSRRFVDIRRFRRVVDIDFLVDDVLKARCPLDVQALRTLGMSGASILHIALTQVATGETRYVTTADPDLDVYEALRATAAMPALYNRQVALRGELYVDGGASALFPVDRAWFVGALDALCVATRPRSYSRSRWRLVSRGLMRVAARGQSHAVRRRMERAADDLNQTLHDVECNRWHDRGRDVWGVWPSDPTRLVSRLERDVDALRRCAEMGRQDMRTVLLSKGIDVPSATLRRIA